jgi:hypothetical protein
MSRVKRSDIPTYYDTITRYYIDESEDYCWEFLDITDLEAFCHHNPEYTEYSYHRSIPNASKTIKSGPQSWGFACGNVKIPAKWRVTCYKCGCKGHYANECASGLR